MGSGGASLAMAAMAVRILGSENERGVSEGQAEGELGRLSGQCRGTETRRSTWSMLPHTQTCVALSGISPNTSRVAVWVKLSTDLGHLQAKFGDRPKMKFSLLLMLYNFD
jgi:hypothetical protein